MTGGKEDDEQDLTSRYELDSAILQTDNSVNTGRDFKFKALKESSTHSIKKGALAISQAQESEKIKWSLMP